MPIMQQETLIQKSAYVVQPYYQSLFSDSTMKLSRSLGLTTEIPWDDLYKLNLRLNPTNKARTQKTMNIFVRMQTHEIGNTNYQD